MNIALLYKIHLFNSLEKDQRSVIEAWPVCMNCGSLTHTNNIIIRDDYLIIEKIWIIGKQAGENKNVDQKKTLSRISYSKMNYKYTKILFKFNLFTKCWRSVSLIWGKLAHTFFLSLVSSLICSFLRSFPLFVILVV